MSTKISRTAAGYAIPTVWILILVALYGQLSPVTRLLGATVGLLVSIKLASVLLLSAQSRAYTLSPVQWLLFWTAWPGVRPDLFAGTHGHEHGPEARQFLEGYLFVVAGGTLVVVSVLAVPVVGGEASTWLLIAGLLATVHLGVGRLLPFGLRWLGYSVPDLFRAPLASRSVGDFWSVRWNRPFVNMNRLLLTRPLGTRFGMAVAALVAFLVSGVLHELAISYPAGAGWGLPLLYFVVQGGAYTVEQSLPVDVEARPVLGRLWTYAIVFVPLPLLFHGPFRTTFLLPVVEFGRSFLFAYPLTTYLGVALWIGAAAHVLVLAASFQVPEKLGWKEDLQSLTRFNRKLMWTYGGFIVLTIVCFGVLTALFHGHFVAGEPVALGVAGMIAVFWTARILVDLFYFSHEDWPGGIEFVVGHALLTSLFVLLVIIYGGTIIVHVL